jgi:hypothetical protein
MIDKETVRKMLENRACDGIDCVQCPVFINFYQTRCCEKNDKNRLSAEDGRKFRPRVVRLLTEWLAEQED